MARKRARLDLGVDGGASLAHQGVLWREGGNVGGSGGRDTWVHRDTLPAPVGPSAWYLPQLKKGSEGLKSEGKGKQPLN